MLNKARIIDIFNALSTWTSDFLCLVTIHSAINFTFNETSFGAEVG